MKDFAGRPTYPDEPYKNTDPYTGLPIEELRIHMEITDGTKGKTPPQFFDFGAEDPDSIAGAIHIWAAEKGWNSPTRTYDAWTALFHTEISEAYEEYRAGHEPTEIYYSVDAQGFDKPEGISIELADEVIRIMHWFAANEMSLNEVLELKMNYNAIRAYRHGGKRT